MQEHRAQNNTTVHSPFSSTTMTVCCHQPTVETHLCMCILNAEALVFFLCFTCLFLSKILAAPTQRKQKKRLPWKSFMKNVLFSTERNTLSIPFTLGTRLGNERRAQKAFLSASSQPPSFSSSLRSLLGCVRFFCVAQHPSWYPCILVCPASSRGPGPREKIPEINGVVLVQKIFFFSFCC